MSAKLFGATLVGGMALGAVGLAALLGSLRCNSDEKRPVPVNYSVVGEPEVNPSLHYGPVNTTQEEAEKISQNGKVIYQGNIDGVGLTYIEGVNKGYETLSNVLVVRLDGERFELWDNVDGMPINYRGRRPHLENNRLEEILVTEPQKIKLEAHEMHNKRYGEKVQKAFAINNDIYTDVTQAIRNYLIAEESVAREAPINYLKSAVEKIKNR